MKKRYILGSAIVALLMLVSTQIVFLETVKSDDPTPHSGDADVGDLWISELDVSAELETVDNIGISHVNATDDWVIWGEGTGNMTADWSVDIWREHPEYNVIFSFIVINVDDNCNEIGNDSFSKTYTAGMDYDESGTLTVALEFTQQQQEHPQTLVCSLVAYVRINQTSEAVNLTSIADDHCVVAVEFRESEGQPPPFSRFTEIANVGFPSMWSWIYGWSDPGKFSCADDMLNTQTYFQVGRATTYPSGGAETWYLGEFDIDIHATSMDLDFIYPQQKTVDWSYNWPDEENGTWITGKCRVDYDIYPKPRGNPIIWMRYEMECTEEQTWYPATQPKVCKKTWTEDCDWEGEIPGRIWVEKDDDEDGYIDCMLHAWVWVYPWDYGDEIAHKEGWVNSDYKVHIVEDGGNEPPTGGSTYYWEEKCAYATSSTIGVTNETSSGITTIYVAISDVLDGSDEVIYSFAADTDDVRVEFICPTL